MQPHQRSQGHCTLTKTSDLRRVFLCLNGSDIPWTFCIDLLLLQIFLSDIMSEMFWQNVRFDVKKNIQEKLSVILADGVVCSVNRHMLRWLMADSYKRHHGRIDTPGCILKLIANSSANCISQ